ncbi:TonB-dependent receptor domain-containing protein [Phenylobacterium sp.]|uniref:TonB-dependent receptor domain-containing protein n=1 Tax=Phenylobacterium sp. TaxID=1871053 RepID=UPI0035ADE15A
MSHRFRNHLFASLAAPALCLSPIAASAAQAQPPTTAPAAAEALVAFDIRAGALDASLVAFMRQAHVQLIYTAQSVRGRRAAAVQGRLSASSALSRLLAGTDLEAQQASPGVLVLKPRPASISSAPGWAAPPPDPTAGGGAVSLAAATSSAPVGGSAPPKTEPAVLSELVVTGSLIHGAGPSASPIVTISRDDLDRSGRATLADYLATLPQNFSGAVTPSSFLAGTDRLGTNSIVAQGVNLRALGPSATLVLVGGRRMAGAGLKGDFADVSAIPTAAIARVEILLDGASALYGSDAVGGVINVILRDDFDGVETRARVGGADDGGAERQVGQTFGRTWSGGHALLTYEYYHQDPLASSARPFTADADLRSLGGTDHRQFYSHPGNIMQLDPLSGVYVPGWAIPPGQAGTGLTPASFLAGQVNLENQRQRTDILPDQTRHSVYASVGQALGEHLDFNADARFSNRDFAYDLPGAVSLLTIKTNNPYFVSPNGATSNQIAYDFTDELGPLHQTGSSKSLGLTAGLDAHLGRTWTLEAYGAYADELSRRATDHRLNTRFLSEALGTIADDPTTPFSTARDGYFNPYGASGANSAAVLSFIGSGWNHTRFESQVTSANFKADGTWLALPGGDLKVAVGGQVRWERFQTRTESLVSKATPTTTLEGPYDRTVSAAFLELRAPLVGPGNALPGVERLELSLAGRIERYSDVGVTRNPKIGVLWAPADGWSLRASYGTSFRAPALSDIYELQDAGPGLLPFGGTSKLVLLRVGGNLNLKPETAKSWTIGLDVAPPRVPGLKVSLTGFDTRFVGRIAQPVADDIYNALSNPVYAPFIHAVNPANPADLALVTQLLAQSTSSAAGLFPASAYTAIVDARFLNTGGLHVRGLDASVYWGFDAGPERFDLTGSATWLADYERQVTPTAAWVELAGTAGQPARVRAQTAATWTHQAFATTVGLNFADGSRDASGKQVGAWTTADLQLAWRSPAETGLTHDLALMLSIRNLFDADPPFYDSPQGIGYDPANADPLRRVISFQVAKRW